MTIGEQIKGEIMCASLCYIPEDPICRYDVRWKPSAAEQLEALLQSHIESEVKRRIAELMNPDERQRRFDAARKRIEESSD